MFILVFMLQSELVKYLKVTLCLGLQFVFAVTLFACDFCLWSCWCGGWRSVKPIKFWQHDKRFNNRKLNTYLHFFVILIDMYCLKKLLYDYQYISSANTRDVKQRGKFSYWKLVTFYHTNFRRRFKFRDWRWATWPEIFM